MTPIKMERQDHPRAVRASGEPWRTNDNEDPRPELRTCQGVEHGLAVVTLGFVAHHRSCPTGG